MIGIVALFDIGSGPERQRSVASRPGYFKFLTFDDGGRCKGDGEVSECAIEEEKQGDGCEAHRIHYEHLKVVNSSCGEVYDRVARNARETHQCSVLTKI